MGSDSGEKDRLKEVLEDAGIDSVFEYDFQKTVENKIRRSKLDADDIEPKLDYLVCQLSTISREDAKSVVTTSSPKERSLKFLINQKHNVRSCPECKAIYLKSDSYCHKCGLRLKKPDYEEELSNLEKLYDRKISHEINSSFKFAYVIYLDYLNRHNSMIPESEISQYNVTLEELTKKAAEDGYIEGDLNRLNLIDLLGRNHLKASGEKLIKLNRHPSAASVLSKDAVDFIDDNRHALFYNSHRELKRVINIDLYDDLFERKCRPLKRDIVETIGEYLTRQYHITLSNYEITRYYNVLYILSRCHEYLENTDLAFKSYFRIFIMDLNNFTEEVKGPMPEKSKIDSEVVRKLVRLLDENCVNSSELKRLFNESYSDINGLGPKIGCDEALIYFLRIFNGESVADVERSIHLKYS